MKSDFNNVCIVYTPYSLYLYLLYSTEEEINNTFYFLGEGIDKRIRDKFENKHYFSDALYGNKKPLGRLIYHIRLRYQARKKWPFLADAQLFVQDSFFFSAALIAKRNYTLIEDAPNIFHRWREVLNRQRKTFSQVTHTAKRLFRILIENSFYKEMGDNAQCTSVLMTKIESDPILKDKQVIQVNEIDYWNNASESKKNKILSIYDVTPEDILELKKRKNILFTNNLTQLSWMKEQLTEQELIDIYVERLTKYDPDTVIIKKHPRDMVDYQKYFPDIYVFDKHAPMQLLNLIDIRYETAITILSSAVLSFPYPIHIDWIGTEIHPKLLASFGKITLEDYFNNTKPT